MNNIFPLGIATGTAFCNRVQEKAKLRSNIENNRHTVLLAPRRYGKTSLITEVIRLIDYPYCEIDFLLAVNAAAIEMKILDKIGNLLNQLLPRSKKAKEKILNLYRNLRPEITLSALGQKVVLHSPSTRANHESTICEALLNLDKAAQVANKRIIVFMDEFQQIGELKEKHGIEASIRHAVERSRNTSYIFSGSIRHLLLQIFSDKNRPFYRLCDIFTIKRIHENEYRDFIQKQAMIKWKKSLPDKVIFKILAISESHSYYLNLICNYFWGNNQQPTLDNLTGMWEEYIKSQKSVIAYDLSLLSNNQKNVLSEIAKHSINQPYGKDLMLRAELTPASIREALKKLKEKDIIYEDESGFIKVLDPAVKSYINSL